jgi:hypothetical protein
VNERSPVHPLRRPPRRHGQRHRDESGAKEPEAPDERPEIAAALAEGQVEHGARAWIDRGTDEQQRRDQPCPERHVAPAQHEPGRKQAAGHEPRGLFDGREDRAARQLAVVDVTRMKERSAEARDDRRVARALRRTVALIVVGVAGEIQPRMTRRQRGPGRHRREGQLEGAERLAHGRPAVERAAHRDGRKVRRDDQLRGGSFGRLASEEFALARVEATHAVDAPQ